MTSSDTQKLYLYNTLTRRKERFVPLDPGHVRVYSCGPTVYGLAHIGNARPIIVFDVLFRLLRIQYGVENVVYVRNITDVDDKINVQAKHEKIPIHVLAERNIVLFQQDMHQLGILAPTVEPRATEHISVMIEMIERLMQKGFAYVSEGHVFFSTKAMDSAHRERNDIPPYGQLARHSQNELHAGVRVEISPHKRDPVDFVLWKPSSSELPGWASPWGRGRPGWHIECSAMSWRYLGETFDIHCGGADLMFPHHENEIAQTCCAFSVPHMARIWLHNGLLRIDGRKMSKSLDNFLPIRSILERWPAQVLRLQMLMTHYRQPLNWSVTRCQEALRILERWHTAIGDSDSGEEDEKQGALPDSVLAALCDDLNTPAVIGEMHKLYSVGAYRDLSRAARFLGLVTDMQSWRRITGGRTLEANLPIDSGHVEVLIQDIAHRCMARRVSDWQAADSIRERLQNQGVSVRDVQCDPSRDMVTEFTIPGVGRGSVTLAEEDDLGSVQIQWADHE